MRIKVLSDETINKIAAGEVVERPLSIVKELLENAIDAGARSIAVEIREGGISLIRITDNGCGIPAEDVRTAFRRHATSKIGDADDLLHIQTLGFRGEALASIAAVSSVELITKQQEALMAVRYEIDGGAEQSFSEIGAPDGTTILVRNLFKNVPARRKFLKSPATEAARIQEIVEMEALAHPEIAFKYLQDGRQKLSTLGNGSLKDVIYSIFGREIAANLIPLDRAYEPNPLTGLPAVRVRGFLGKPVITRSNRNFEIYFVNGRYVKNQLITKALEDGYKAFLMQHKFPFAVLCIDLNPETVDVNVHPQKMELRFSNGMLVYNSVCDSVNQALAAEELVVRAVPGQPEAEKDGTKGESLPHVEPFEARRDQLVRQQALAEQQKQYVADNVDMAQQKQYTAEGQEGKLAEKNLTYGGEPAGEQNQKQTSFQNADGYVQKTHGASGTGTSQESQHIMSRTTGNGSAFTLNHFVMAAETTSGNKGQEGTEAQADRSAAQVQVPQKPEQTSLFTDAFLSEKARLRHRIIGQVFETYWLIEYDNSLYIIDQHAAHEKVMFERMMEKRKTQQVVSQYLNPPILLTLTANESNLLERFQESFAELGYEINHMGERDYSVTAVPADLPSIGKKALLLEMLDGLTEEAGLMTADAIYDKIASMSCKAAVKGGNRLSMMEADALIEELLGLENPYACPHGRPTIIAMSKYELEKKFKRVL